MLTNALQNQFIGIYSSEYTNIKFPSMEQARASISTTKFLSEHDRASSRPMFVHSLPRKKIYIKIELNDHRVFIKLQNSASIKHEQQKYEFFEHRVDMSRYRAE